MHMQALNPGGSIYLFQGENDKFFAENSRGNPVKIFYKLTNSGPQSHYSKPMLAGWPRELRSYYKEISRPKWIAQSFPISANCIFFSQKQEDPAFANFSSEINNFRENRNL